MYWYEFPEEQMNKLKESNKPVEPIDYRGLKGEELLDFDVWFDGDNDNNCLAKETRTSHIRLAIDELNRIRVENGLQPITD